MVLSSYGPLYSPKRAGLCQRLFAALLTSIIPATDVLALFCLTMAVHVIKLFYHVLNANAKQH